MAFQKTTITVALITLIIVLLIVAFMVRRANETAQWPPMISECPDYFEVNMGPSTGGKIECNNVKGLGTCGAMSSFGDNKFNGSAGLSAKKKWAQNCNVTWDGITNNDSIPDLTDTTVSL